MIRASVLLLVVGLACVSGYGFGGSGEASGWGSGRGGVGAKAGATGVLDSSGRVAGKAHLGHGGLFGGLLNLNDVDAEGEAEGGINAEGTIGGNFGGSADASGSAAGRAYAGF